MLKSSERSPSPGLGQRTSSHAWIEVLIVMIVLLLLSILFAEGAY